MHFFILFQLSYNISFTFCVLLVILFAYHRWFRKFTCHIVTRSISIIAHCFINLFNYSSHSHPPQECFSPHEIGVTVQRGSPLRRKFDMWVLRMVEAGLIEHWFLDSLRIAKKVSCYFIFSLSICLSVCLERETLPQYKRNVLSYSSVVSHHVVKKERKK